jgi:hypothetical protein
MCENIEFIGMERKLCSVTFRPIVKDRAPASSDHDFWVRRIPLTSSAEAASFTVVVNMRGKGGPASWKAEGPRLVEKRHL